MKTILLAMAAMLLLSSGAEVPALTPDAARESMACGIPPIPPIGCRAQCVCDADGTDCHWTFICN